MPKNQYQRAKFVIQFAYQRNGNQLKLFFLCTPNICHLMYRVERMPRRIGKCNLEDTGVVRVAYSSSELCFSSSRIQGLANLTLRRVHSSSNRISIILAASKVFDAELGAMLAPLKYYYMHTIITMSSPNPRLFFLLFHVKNCWNVNKSPYFYRFVPSTIICIVVKFCRS